VAALEAYFRARPESAQAQDPQVHAFSGAAYFLNKQYAEAQRDLESVLRVFAQDVPARVTLAAVYTARGDWSRGIALYAQLAGARARQPLLRFNPATCLQHLRRLAEAEREAAAYVEARPQDPRGLVLLGDIRADRKDAAGALEAWGWARKLDATVDVAAR